MWGQGPSGPQDPVEGLMGGWAECVCAIYENAVLLIQEWHQSEMEDPQFAVRLSLHPSAPSLHSRPAPDSEVPAMMH